MKPGKTDWIAAMVILSSLALILWQFFKLEIFPIAPHAIDPVTQYEKRLSMLKSVLPEKGTTGYIREELPEDMQSVMAFILSQYSLAPLIVIKGTDSSIVIGNFHHVIPAPREWAAKKLRLRRDFQNGVMLFDKSGR